MPSFDKLKHSSQPPGQPSVQPPVRRNLALIGVLAFIVGSILGWNLETADTLRQQNAEFEETTIASTAPDIAAPDVASASVAAPGKPVVAPVISVSKTVTLTPASERLADSMLSEEMARAEDAKRALAKKDLEARILAEPTLAERSKITKRIFKEELKKKYPKIQSECFEEEFKDTQLRQRALENLFDNFSELEDLKTRLKPPASASYLRCLENQIADETEACKLASGLDEEDSDLEFEDDKEERKKLRSARKELVFCLKRVLSFKSRVLDRRISESQKVPSQLLDVLKEAVIMRAQEKAMTAQNSQQVQSWFRESIFDSVGICGPSNRSNNKVNCILQSLWPQNEGLVSSRFTIPLLLQAYEAQRGAADRMLPYSSVENKVRFPIPKSQGLAPRKSNRKDVSRSRKQAIDQGSLEP